MAYIQPVNSTARPDTTLASAYTPGDGVLNVASCPPRAAIRGPILVVKVGSKLYHVTALGAGNVVWEIPDGPMEGTGPDASHLSGANVYLEFTEAIIDETRGVDVITATDQTANGWPASVPLSDVLLTDLDDTGFTASPTSHNHTNAAGDGGILTADQHDSFSEYAEIASPSTPASGKVRLYPKADGHMYIKDDAGTETDLTGGGADVSDADPADTAAVADAGVDPEASRADHVHQLGDHDHTAGAGDGGTIPASSVTGLATVATTGDYEDLSNTPDPATVGHYEILVTGASPTDPITNMGDTDYLYGWVG